MTAAKRVEKIDQMAVRSQQPLIQNIEIRYIDSGLDIGRTPPFANTVFVLIKYQVTADQNEQQAMFARVDDVAKEVSSKEL